jgi:DNA modification methylase
MATVEAVTDGKPVNGIFTSPPYAMQRAKQYGGVSADEYVEWWEAVQENMRAVLAEDGSFFVNIKPHCEDGQRVLYVFDLVLAMVRRWGWRFVDELCWKHQGIMGKWPNRFKNRFEPVYHFSLNKDIKLCHQNVIQDFSNNTNIPRLNNYDGMDNAPALGGSPFKQMHKRSALFDGALPSNIIEIANSVISSHSGAHHSAPFPLKLPTFFIKAYSDPIDTWLDPFAGSGTTALAAETEGRLGLMVEQLPKYCAVILERFQAHTSITPELIK